MATAPLLAPQTSFYKRPLPSTCVAFASDEGKRLFAGALREGNMDGYFKLAGSLETQSDPAYCGLGTLCSILNALEVDPQRKWKGAWRYYDQSMLDCCRPLESVAAIGITLSEFVCLARCNGLTAKVTSPLLDCPATKRAEGLAKFRVDLKVAAQGRGAMAISYDRRTLGQTGSGHFSPVGGYNEGEDKLLILDVARFKYSYHWVPVEMAYDAMLPLDKATGLPRGYVHLEVAGSEPGSLSAPLSLTSLTLNKSTWATLSLSLSKLLLSSSKTSPSASQLLSLVLTHLSTLLTPPLAPRPLPAPTHHSPPSALPALLDALGRTRLAKAAVSSLPPSAAVPLSRPNSDGPPPVLPQHSLLSLLLSLSLLSPRSSLAALIPPSAASELSELMAEALEAVDGVREETEVVTKQLGALGECCRSEEDAGAACGCAVGGKVA